MNEDHDDDLWNILAANAGPQFAAGQDNTRAGHLAPEVWEPPAASEQQLFQQQHMQPGPQGWTPQSRAEQPSSQGSPPGAWILSQAPEPQELRGHALQGVPEGFGPARRQVSMEIGLEETDVAPMHQDVALSREPRGLSDDAAETASQVSLSALARDPQQLDTRFRQMAATYLLRSVSGSGDTDASKLARVLEVEKKRNALIKLQLQAAAESILRQVSIYEAKEKRLSELIADLQRRQGISEALQQNEWVILQIAEEMDGLTADVAMDFCQLASKLVPHMRENIPTVRQDWMPYGTLPFPCKVCMLVASAKDVTYKRAWHVPHHKSLRQLIDTDVATHEEMQQQYIAAIRNQLELSDDLDILSSFAAEDMACQLVMEWLLIRTCFTLKSPLTLASLSGPVAVAPNIKLQEALVAINGFDQAKVPRMWRLWEQHCTAAAAIAQEVRAAKDHVRACIHQLSSPPSDDSSGLHLELMAAARRLKAAKVEELVANLAFDHKVYAQALGPLLLAKLLLMLHPYQVSARAFFLANLVPQAKPDSGLGAA